MDYIFTVIIIYTYLANYKLYLLIFSFLIDLNNFSSTG